MSQGVECYSCLPKTAWPPTCCIKAYQFMEILKEKNIPFESDFFATAWTDTYTFDEAKEYAYDQLKRKDITPNEAIVESILATFMKVGKVHVTTEAEKGMILWKAA